MKMHDNFIPIRVQFEKKMEIKDVEQGILCVQYHGELFFVLTAICPCANGENIFALGL